jgi:hypothetical protein
LSAGLSSARPDNHLIGKFALREIPGGTPGGLSQFSKPAASEAAPAKPVQIGAAAPPSIGLFPGSSKPLEIREFSRYRFQPAAICPARRCIGINRRALMSGTLAKDRAQAPDHHERNGCQNQI